MKKPVTWEQRIAVTSRDALAGAVCGALLASFGSAISGSTTAAVATILVVCALGAWAGRLPGAILGGLVGPLLVAFGSVVAGSALGAALTVVGCAGLCGWLRWASLRQPSEAVSLAESFRPLAAGPAVVIRDTRGAKELVLWN